MPSKNTYQIIMLWLLMVIISVPSRTFLPIDETRYITVAWNMWLNGDYLVPYLNGVAYSHKPPLLFWLVNFGWKIFGVDDWWPRLLPALVALASTFITRGIAQKLWPDQPSVKNNAAFILISSGLWVAYSTALMFDMLIAFFTLLGINGLLIAHQDHKLKGWVYLAVAIAGGLLAKGPTILLQILPVGFLASWWGSRKDLNAKNWYLPMIYCVIAGVIIALCWAIPAGLRGGKAYEYAIFWGQTADRVVHSFAHDRPFWWYLPLLPLLLFPWLFWGAFWQGLFNKSLIRSELGVRFCLAWIVPVFIVFSVISGKQIHYILPIIPAFAILIARIIENGQYTTRTHILPIGIVMVIIGLALVYLPFLEKLHPAKPAPWLKDMPILLGVFITVTALALFVSTRHSAKNAVKGIALSFVGIIAITMHVIVQTAGDAYDLRPISAKLKTLENQHIPLANSGKYPGIFNYLGRLNQSPIPLKLDKIAPWFNAHPNGRLIEYIDADVPLYDVPREYIQPYRGSYVVIFNHEQWLHYQTSSAK